VAVAVDVVDVVVVRIDSVVDYCTSAGAAVVGVVKGDIRRSWVQIEGSVVRSCSYAFDLADQAEASAFAFAFPFPSTKAA
jgi:hypothetical protein